MVDKPTWLRWFSRSSWSRTEAEQLSSVSVN